MNGIPEGYEEVTAFEIPEGYEEVPQAPPVPPETSGFVGGDVPLMEHTPEETQENVRMLAQGAVAAPFYAIPYAGPAAGGLMATVAGRAVDRAHGVESKHGFLEEAGMNVGLAYGGLALGKAAGVGWRMLPEPAQARIASAVRKGFEKGIRPSVVGKGNAQQTKVYFQKAQMAVESIIENKPGLQFADDVGQITKGQLPQNLKQFSEAIDQTKREIFRQYDEIIKSSGADLSIPLTDISQELLQFSGGKVNMMFGETSSKYAFSMAEKFEGNALTLLEAQEAIAILNSKLNAFYKNPTLETATNAAVDSMVANRLRTAVDAAVEGSGYQALKNQYGALRTVEKEVSNRAVVDARKNIKGLIDFSDIATASQAAKAIALMSKGHGASAVAIAGMKSLYKHINNPNRIVKQMFVDVDKLVPRRQLMTP